jgi:hypothetical protein
MDGEPKIAVLADEDVEEDPDRWCSYTECGQELWQIACQWVWNLRLALGQQMQTNTVREIEWAPVKEAPPLFVAVENAPQEYGPWQWARQFGAATGRFGAEAFPLQENGMLRCEAGSKPLAERNASRKCLYATGRLRCLEDWTVHTVNCGNNAWDEERRAIVLVGSVQSAVFYPVLCQ